MPDGPPTRGPSDDNFDAWIRQQAAMLREVPVCDDRFDRENPRRRSTIRAIAMKTGTPD